MFGYFGCVDRLNGLIADWPIRLASRVTTIGPEIPDYKFPYSPQSESLTFCRYRFGRFCIQKNIYAHSLCDRWWCFVFHAIRCYCRVPTSSHRDAVYCKRARRAWSWRGRCRQCLSEITRRSECRQCYCIVWHVHYCCYCYCVSCASLFSYHWLWVFWLFSETRVTCNYCTQAIRPSH